MLFRSLMHDATEAYISDVATPWKPLLPQYRLLERQIDEPLRLWANLPAHKTTECDKADWIALFIETIFLINGAGADFDDPYMVRQVALDLVYKEGVELLYMSPKYAREAFLLTYEKLKDGELARNVLL